ncbi:MAG: tRNA (guanosine(46)-N7)-methyltransferase TrmB [Selenomonadaceae bacterium]|nr:tRNA (guanosine(46)-N7)-methyltransferase TrmB [Selenomonadaceae bacterium]MBR7025281.1 tRNA (guanosine(46)-N7)-methyltransferase TrmB [Selenomonadaceae bacterium]
MRLRKKPHTDEKLQNFIDFVTVGDVEPIKKDSANELHVELGTGKGDFITQIAERNPQINFIGLEVEATCVLAAARKVREKNLSNVRLIVFDVSNIAEIFSEHEVDRLYINFCDPWPKKRHAKRRLTNIKFLEQYKKILKVGGEIFFKTDNRALFDYSLEQFALAGLEVHDVTNDLHASEPPENIRTEYENKFSEQGVPINFCVVKFGNG